MVNYESKLKNILTKTVNRTISGMAAGDFCGMQETIANGKSIDFQESTAISYKINFGEVSLDDLEILYKAMQSSPPSYGMKYEPPFRKGGKFAINCESPCIEALLHPDEE